MLLCSPAVHNDQGAYPLKTMIDFHILYYQYLKSLEKVFEHLCGSEPAIKVGRLMSGYNGLIWSLRYKKGHVFISLIKGEYSSSFYSIFPFLQDIQSWEEKDYIEAIKKAVRRQVTTRYLIKIKDVSQALKALGTL